MSTIKIFALGGLGENGKNMYCVSVDEKIFVLDAGSKYPSVDMLGVDAVISDISTLIENKNNIVGLFLSHGHEENIGAANYLLDNLRIPVFGSNFTISVLESMLVDDGKDLAKFKLFRVNDDKVLSFGDVTVSFFATTHSVPQSLGISINTLDGSIVYAPDFSLTFTKEALYQTAFNKISKVAENKCLALLPESLGVNNFNRVTDDNMFNIIIQDTLARKARVLFTLYSYDLNRIQKICDLCVKAGRKIAIIGRRTQRLVGVGLDKNFIKIPKENFVNLRFRDNYNDNNDLNLAVLVTGIRHEPFYMMTRMMNNQDKLIQLSKTDVVINLTPTIVGTERIATRSIDQMNHIVRDVISIPKQLIKSSHANAEDLKMLYQIMNPEYIIPVIGEYRHLYMQKDIAINAGYNSDNIVMLENGMVATFIDGKLEEERGIVKTGDVLIDGTIIGNMNDVVLKDRENLASVGAIVVSIVIDKKAHKIISPAYVSSKGFMDENDYRYSFLESAIEEETIRVVKNILKTRTIDWNELKTLLKENVGKVVHEHTSIDPIIIPVIIDCNGENI